MHIAAAAFGVNQDKQPVNFYALVDTPAIGFIAALPDKPDAFVLTQDIVAGPEIVRGPLAAKLVVFYPPPAPAFGIPVVKRFARAIEGLGRVGIGIGFAR